MCYGLGMQKYFSLFFLVCFNNCFGAIPITEDITKAKCLAQSYDLPMIYLVTGSDWCPWSKKMLNEIFASSEFEKNIGNQFIFIKLDFPELNLKGTKTLSEHQKLKEDFNVESFPTLIMTDSNNNEITRINYTQEGPEKYADHLKSLYIEYKSLKREYENTDLKTSSMGIIQTLYKRACELQCPVLKEEILETGLKVDDGSYFALEKYTQLINMGNVAKKEAVDLKTKILACKGDDNQGIRLRLALLDFQANENNPEKAVEPIGTYIADFGKSDHDNLWRLHLIISEYFQKQGLEEKAFEHAQKSLVEAPRSIKAKVQQALDHTFSNDEKTSVDPKTQSKEDL